MRTGVSTHVQQTVGHIKRMTDVSILDENYFVAFTIDTTIMAIMTRMAIPIIMRIYRGQVAIEDSSKGKQSTHLHIFPP